MTEKDKSRFMLVCAPRTGSTMLRLLLNSHSMICSHGELFSHKSHMSGFVGVDRYFVGTGQKEKVDTPIYQKLKDIRDTDPLRFLHEFVLYPGSFSVVGFKILYGTLWAPDWRILFGEILADKDIRIVHLTRENRLKRFLSAHVVNNVTGVTVVVSEDEKPKVAMTSVLEDECIADVERVAAEELQIRREFSEHQVFEITYEEILNSSRNKLVELQKFLGVDPELLTTPTVKVLSDKLQDVIENYRELSEAFRGTRYETYFK